MKTLELSNMRDCIEALKDFLPEDPIFICVGTTNVGFDSFGPIAGSILNELGFKVYGTIEDPINGLTIYDQVERIMKEEGIDNLENDERIIGIDASVTSREEDLYKVILKNEGVKPGSGMGKMLPYIGSKSIKFPTVIKGENIAEKCIESNLLGEDRRICESAANMLAVLIDNLTIMA